MKDKRLIKKKDTFETEGRACTEAGKLQGDYVKMWLFLVGYMHERVSSRKEFSSIAVVLCKSSTGSL